MVAFFCTRLKNLARPGALPEGCVLLWTGIVFAVKSQKSWAVFK